MTVINLDKLSRQERLKQVIEDVKNGKKFSAFDLCVQYNVSMNVIYRDISALREEGYIPKEWQFEKRVPLTSNILEDVEEEDPLKNGS